MGQTCQGIQVHTDLPYRHEQFQPYRLINLFLKAVRLVHPDYPMWRDFAYTAGASRSTSSTAGHCSGWVDDPRPPSEIARPYAADEQLARHPPPSCATRPESQSRSEAW